ncbi:hypothetical protein BOX15_Mlig005390g3 [Macrostomum lignano]|uniref:M-phase inducer phosphatase n=2 Tax=Macrostomum lignano TaxID=282301 RepID=A0A267GGK1_9PLAT|nr:hypothetical protein BOX15_Mlig005390g3 [Macrostomum lignano]
MDVSFTTDRESFSPAASATVGTNARMPFSDSAGLFNFSLDDCSHDDSFMRFVNSPNSAAVNAALTLPAPLSFDDDDDDEDDVSSTACGMDWGIGSAVAFRPSPSEPSRRLPAGQPLASELPRLPSAPPPQPPSSSSASRSRRLSCKKRPSPMSVDTLNDVTTTSADFAIDIDDVDDKDEDSENRCPNSGANKCGTPKRRRLGRPLGDLTNSTTPTFKKPPTKTFSTVASTVPVAAPAAALHRCASEIACSSSVDGTPGNSRPSLHRQESAATALDSARVDRAIASIDSLNLIGNSEQRHALPTVKELDYGIRHVTSDTVSRLVNGEFSSTVPSYAIIDCRYPYEFSGGHIQGAVNVFTQEDLLRRFLEPASQAAAVPATKASVLIFHCEFSSERAPKLARFLRQRDREANVCNYPDLFYPEVYVLQGGYKAFYDAFKSNCQPAKYVKMVDPEHKAELTHFQRLTRSWERQHSRSKHSRLVAASKVLF